MNSQMIQDTNNSKTNITNLSILYTDIHNTYRHICV